MSHGSTERSLTAICRNRLDRAHMQSDRFHQRRKTKDGWRAIIVWRAIRYSV